MGGSISNNTVTSKYRISNWHRGRKILLWVICIQAIGMGIRYGAKKYQSDWNEFRRNEEYFEFDHASFQSFSNSVIFSKTMKVQFDFLKQLGEKAGVSKIYLSTMSACVNEFEEMIVQNEIMRLSLAYLLTRQPTDQELSTLKTKWISMSHDQRKNELRNIWDENEKNLAIKNEKMDHAQRVADWLENIGIVIDSITTVLTIWATILLSIPESQKLSK